MITLWNTLIASINAIGVIPFIIIIVVDILLWRIHPVLGLLGTLLTFAYLVHWI